MNNEADPNTDTFGPPDTVHSQLTVFLSLANSNLDYSSQVATNEWNANETHEPRRDDEYQ